MVHQAFYLSFYDSYFQYIATKVKEMNPTEKGILITF